MINLFDPPKKETILKNDYIIEITFYPAVKQEVTNSYKFKDLSKAIQFVEEVYEKNPKAKYKIKLYQDITERDIIIDYQN